MRVGEGELNIERGNEFNLDKSSYLHGCQYRLYSGITVLARVWAFEKVKWCVGVEFGASGREANGVSGVVLLFLQKNI